GQAALDALGQLRVAQVRERGAVLVAQAVMVELQRGQLLPVLRRLLDAAAHLYLPLPETADDGLRALDLALQRHQLGVVVPDLAIEVALVGQALAAHALVLSGDAPDLRVVFGVAGARLEELPGQRLLVVAKRRERLGQERAPPLLI